MSPTREFKDTIQARTERDPAFREELLKEGVECLLSGDVDTGKAVLRDYINATIGFRELSGMPAKSPKSLMRTYWLMRRVAYFVSSPQYGTGPLRRPVFTPCTWCTGVGAIDSVQPLQRGVVTGEQGASGPRSADRKLRFGTKCNNNIRVTEELCNSDNVVSAQYLLVCSLGPIRERHVFDPVPRIQACVVVKRR